MPISLSGVAAYLLLWAGAASGVAVSSESIRRRAGWLHSPVHETLSLAGLAAALWHALAIGANAWLAPLRWVYVASASVLAAGIVLRLGERAQGDLPGAT